MSCYCAYIDPYVAPRRRSSRVQSRQQRGLDNRGSVGSETQQQQVKRFCCQGLESKVAALLATEFNRMKQKEKELDDRIKQKEEKLDRMRQTIERMETKLEITRKVAERLFRTQASAVKDLTGRIQELEGMLTTNDESFEEEEMLDTSPESFREILESIRNLGRNNRGNSIRYST